MIFLSVIFWLALFLGIIAASAALYGRYKILPAMLTGPVACRLEDGGCAVLFRTKEAALIGPPNAFLGIVFYAFLAAATAFGWPEWLLLTVASPSLLMSIYLGRFLLTNHLQCRICWAGHVSNAVIWISLLMRLIL